MKLIENWRIVYKFWSVRLTAVGTLMVGYIAAVPDILVSAWNMLPADLRTIIPPNYLLYISVGIFIAGMFSRVVKQDKLNAECNKSEETANRQA